ncbi:MAG: FtsX-like permease family protein [Planctomycetales bacterium]|nr:FtsX-like permease family protein [Planctomycetales bacterium]
MWNIAVKMLSAQRGKLLTALVGVVFSIVLVNVQGGLFVGLIRKAGLLVNQGDADIWVGHKQMNNVDFPHDIPRSWGQRIRSVAGVALAEPYLVGHSVMTLPSGGFEQVLVVGSDPASQMGSAAQLQWDPDALRQPDAIVVDRLDAHKIDNPALGDLREIGGRRARVTGFTEGVLGFLVTPYVFTTLERATEFLARPSGQVSYFLVKLAPGADAAAVRRRLQARLPDAEVYDSDQYAQISIAYWLQRTGIGISFGAATVLGLFVGLVIVAQTLYASVLDRLAEFGALKAIGARDRQILSLILNQALLLAAAGSALGLIAAAALQQLFSTPRAPIAIPWQIAAGSCVLVTAICLAAAAAPFLRVRRIDPAMVLQS